MKNTHTLHTITSLAVTVITSLAVTGMRLIDPIKEMSANRIVAMTLQINKIQSVLRGKSRIVFICLEFIWFEISHSRTMSQATKKNRRLCETLKLINGYKTGQEAYQHAKDRNVKVKSKPKKCPQGTFSMIKFYQSIPSK